MLGSPEIHGWNCTHSTGILDCMKIMNEDKIRILPIIIKIIEVLFINDLLSASIFN